MDNVNAHVRQQTAQHSSSALQQPYQSMQNGALDYTASSRSGSGVGSPSRPITSARSSSRPASQQTSATQYSDGLSYRTSSGGSQQKQLQSSMQQPEPHGTASHRPYSRLQHTQPVQQGHGEQQHWPPRPVSRLDNYSETPPQDRINSSIGVKNNRPSSISCCHNSKCNNRYNAAAPENTFIHDNECSKTSNTLQHPEQGYAAQQQQQARCANPLFCSNNNNNAAALLANSSRAGTANPQSRISSAAGHLRPFTNTFEASPQCSPRRASVTNAQHSYAAVAAGASAPGQTRPISSNNHRGFSGTGRLSNGGTHSSSPRVQARGPNNALQPSCHSSGAASNSGAAPAATAARPCSSNPLGASNYPQQQQQQGRGYKQLPAGALSQDPPSPNLAAYTHTPSRQQDRRTSRSSNSRPNTASGRPTAATSSGSSCIDSRSSTRQQQLRSVSTAASATAASALYSPRIVRPSSNRSRRPGSAAQRQQQQHQQRQGSGEAAGPLLSDYFRPPSAAAPGSVGLFGLPGLDPPGGLASAVPCIRVPSVHTSWDATAAGLSSDSSFGQQGINTQNGAGNSIGRTAVVEPCCEDAVQQQQQQQQHACGTADKLPRSTEGSSTCATGACHESTPATEGNTDSKTSNSQMQQAESSSQGEMLSVEQQKPMQQQAPGLDGDAAGRPQVLLWSAAHEIDGRPVTRNGERARPPTRGVNSA